MFKCVWYLAKLMKATPSLPKSTATLRCGQPAAGPRACKSMGRWNTAKELPALTWSWWSNAVPRWKAANRWRFAGLHSSAGRLCSHNLWRWRRASMLHNSRAATSASSASGRVCPSKSRNSCRQGCPGLHRPPRHPRKASHHIICSLNAADKGPNVREPETFGQTGLFSERRPSLQ